MSNTVSLALFSGAVRGLVAQFEALLTGEAGESQLYAFTTAYTNLTHIFAHVEGNARFLQEDEGLDAVRSFLRSTEFDDRACRWLGTIMTCSPPGERTRIKWHSFFQTRLSKEGNAALREEDRLVGALAAVLSESTLDLTTLLGRLGIERVPGGHDSAFFAVAAQVADSVIRAKLYQTWVAAKSRRNENILAAVQHLVEARFRGATKTLFRTPMAKVLTNATVSISAIDEFLDDYLSEAITLIRDLSHLVRSVVRFPIGLAVDFPRFLSETERGDKQPLVSLHGCVGLLSDIVGRVFGLTLKAITGPFAEGGNVLLVSRDGNPVGLVILHTANAKAGGAYGKGPELSAFSRLPVGYALCRWTSPDRQYTTFDAARLLFHEFGHALVHILAHDRRPGISGLDYLPVERLELLSTWFENWVYHSAIEKIIMPSDRALAGLNHARRVKAFEFMKSNLTRAVCAVVDFRIHLDPCASAQDVVEHLRQRYSEIDQVVESELGADFAHPMLLAHPGCSFVYPLGSSYAMEKFLPLMNRSVPEIGSDICDLKFSITTDGIFPMPDPTAPRVFFGTILRSKHDTAP